LKLRNPRLFSTIEIVEATENDQVVIRPFVLSLISQLSIIEQAMFLVK